MKERVIVIFLVIISVGCFVGCNNPSNQDNIAQVEYYYFECYDSTDVTLSKRLMEDIEKYMQRPWDYILTDESAAKGWPFFGDVKRGTRVKREIIMPPHSTVHRVAPLRNYKREEAAKKLEITILSIDSSQVEVKFRLFSGKTDNWKRIVNQPEHYYSLKENGWDELVEEISKAAIRNTFK